MRISTNQVFTQNINSMLVKQNKTAQLVSQISSGKKVSSAGDDPIAAIGIVNLNQQNKVIDQYLRNINFANHRLSLTESKFDMAENVIAAFRNRVLNVNNAGITDIGRKQIAAEMQEDLNTLLSIANDTDESGNYLFSGFQTDTKPFELDENNNIRYNGDNGVRHASLAYAAEVAVNVNGEQAFMTAENSIGNFSPSYDVEQAGEFYIETARIFDEQNYNNNGLNDYRLSFFDNGNNTLELMIINPDPNAANNIVGRIRPFDSAIPINIHGVEITISGEPKVGDSVEMSYQNNINIFDVMQSTVELVDDGFVQTPYGRSEIKKIIGNIDNAVEKLSVSRTRVGNNLKQLDGFTSRFNEEKVVNANALSILEDLDYSVAISELEEQKFALNAISSVIGRVGSISLFDYL